MLAADLLPYVLPSVQGCPTPLAQRAILDAATEFCRRSRACWLSQTDIVTGADTVDVPYAVPAGQQLYMPVRILVDGRPFANGRFSIAENVVTYTGFPSQGTHSIAATWSLVPGSTDSTLPEACAERREAIASGAKWRLLTMHETQWCNLAVASYEELLFRSGINQARIAANKFFTDASLRVLQGKF